MDHHYHNIPDTIYSYIVLCLSFQDIVNRPKQHFNMFSKYPPFLATSSEKVIPESLLAAAKDHRYVKECERLLLLVGQEIGISRQKMKRWERTAEFSASLLYILTILARKKRTAGMEVCGIEYSKPSHTVFGAVFSAIGIYIVRLVGATSEASRDQDNHRESLSGQNRRRAFEQQHQDMIQRANASLSISSATASQHETGSEERIALSQHKTGSEERIAWPFLERTNQFARYVLRSLYPAVSMPLEGPHVARSDDFQHSTQIHTIAAWILRLHLAMFCIHGQFPSFLHRIIYRSSECLEKGRNDTVLVHRPDTSSIVGCLLFVQAAWGLWQYLSKAAIHRWVDWRLKYSLLSTPNDAQRSIHFQGIRPPPVNTSATCAICQQVRHYPACSVSCGHLFCWQCLQQWVTSNSAACPLCRKSCTSSDILLLCNYDHAAATD